VPFVAPFMIVLLKLELWAVLIDLMPVKVWERLTIEELARECCNNVFREGERRVNARLPKDFGGGVLEKHVNEWCLSRA